MHASRHYIAAMPPSATISADDLPRLTPPNQRSELVRGVLVVREPPGYRHGLVAARLANALASALVWVVDPARRRARVYSADGSEADVPEDGALDGQKILPGFICRLAAIW